MAFKTTQLTKIVGITRARLQEWYARRWVVPSVYEANQPGRHHEWSLVDLYNIAIFKQLTESGLARKVVADLISQGVVSDDVTDEELNRIGFILYMRKGDKAAATAIFGKEIDFGEISKELGLKGFTDCYLINFHQLKNEIDQRIEGGTK
jgi:hypothetical protein